MLTKADNIIILMMPAQTDTGDPGCWHTCISQVASLMQPTIFFKLSTILDTRLVEVQQRTIVQYSFTLRFNDYRQLSKKTLSLPPLLLQLYTAQKSTILELTLCRGESFRKNFKQGWTCKKDRNKTGISKTLQHYPTMECWMPPLRHPMQCTCIPSSLCYLHN